MEPELQRSGQDWTKTTAAGAEYSFYVKEAFKTASSESDNWIFGNFDPATNSITNTVKTGEANLGKLTVKKKPLVNGPGVRSAFRGASLRGTPVKFGFTVTGPNNYSQTLPLVPVKHLGQVLAHADYRQEFAQG